MDIRTVESRLFSNLWELILWVYTCFPTYESLYCESLSIPQLMGIHTVELILFCNLWKLILWKFVHSPTYEVSYCGFMFAFQLLNSHTVGLCPFLNLWKSILWSFLFCQLMKCCTVTAWVRSVTDKRLITSFILATQKPCLGANLTDSYFHSFAFVLFVLEFKCVISSLYPSFENSIARCQFYFAYSRMWMSLLSCYPANYFSKFLNCKIKLKKYSSLYQVRELGQKQKHLTVHLKSIKCFFVFLIWLIVICSSFDPVFNWLLFCFLPPPI